MNKINLKVDIAYAIDYLSILAVKNFYINTDCSLLNYSQTYNDLKGQIPVIDDILSCSEYKDLIGINGKIFDIIEQMKTVEISGKIIDDLNYKRWILKNEIQYKFFGNRISEEKTQR